MSDGVPMAPRRLFELVDEVRTFIQSLPDGDQQFAAISTLIAVMLLEQQPSTVDVVFEKVKERLEVMRRTRG